MKYVISVWNYAGENEGFRRRWRGIIWPKSAVLTHWGRVTHICVSKLNITGSDNGLSPDQRQAIIWTNDGLLLIGLLGTNFNEIIIEILTFSFKKMRLKVSSAKRQPFCLCLHVMITSHVHKSCINHGYSWLPVVIQPLKQNVICVWSLLVLLSPSHNTENVGILCPQPLEI